MDFNATIDLIIRELEDARGIIDDLKKYPGVPHLQVELAKAKCKSAAEVISMLKQEERPKTGDRRPEKEDPRPKTGDRRPEKEDPIPNTDAIRPETEVENPVPAATSPEPEQTTLTPDAIHPSPVKNEILSEQPAKKPSEIGTVGDSFSHLSSRFNEQLGNRKPDDDLSGVIKTKPITSLTEAIGINDRFLFIREIFNGDKNTYSQAVIRLENATSIADARAVIMSYTGDSIENEAVKQLLDLVKRKLPADE